MEKEGKPKATFEDLIKVLPLRDCRYVAYEHNYEKNGMKKSHVMCCRHQNCEPNNFALLTPSPCWQVLFIVWNPKRAHAPDKVMYTTQKFALGKELDGMHNCVVSGEEDLRR